MIRVILCFACLVFYIPPAVCYEEQLEMELLTFNQNEKIVSEKKQYIPLGHHASIKCDVLEKSAYLSEQELQTEWFLMYKNNNKWKSYVLNATDSNKKNRLTVIDNVAYLYGMSTLLDGSVVACLVYPNVSRSSAMKLVSRTILVAQNCASMNEFETPWMNKRNPCRYGSCRVRNDSGFELLECRCMEQYTGFFCDKLVDKATMYELLFYAPVATMTAVLLFVACCFDCVEGETKENKFNFEKHLPKSTISVDLKRCYPTMFITRKQYEEMVAALTSEAASAKDKMEGVPANPVEKKQAEAEKPQKSGKATKMTSTAVHTQKKQGEDKNVQKPTKIETKTPEAGGNEAMEKISINEKIL
ncbi:hypothetical protein DICVIV_10073 [Dictyocaulus viviparus]|uniref:EGF-like domain-containing protein n=1 Tax=Dictyocaulus viviparus TaxID=29172 RepID=A0A0D8XJI1_DICVI|nr:hypothetical protein DICVIV_10073 [Dictyocaulus viviparus]